METESLFQRQAASAHTACPGLTLIPFALESYITMRNISGRGPVLYLVTHFTIGTAPIGPDQLRRTLRGSFDIDPDIRFQINRQRGNILRPQAEQ